MKGRDRVLQKAKARQRDRSAPPFHELVDLARCSVIFDHADACIDALESLADRAARGLDDVVWVNNQSERLLANTA